MHIPLGTVEKYMNDTIRYIRFQLQGYLYPIKSAFAILSIIQTYRNTPTLAMRFFHLIYGFQKIMPYLSFGFKERT